MKYEICRKLLIFFEIITLLEYSHVQNATKTDLYIKSDVSI